MLDATQILKNVLEFDVSTQQWYLRVTLVSGGSTAGTDEDWQQMPSTSGRHALLLTIKHYKQRVVMDYSL